MLLKRLCLMLWQFFCAWVLLVKCLITGLQLLKILFTQKSNAIIQLNMMFNNRVIYLRHSVFLFAFGQIEVIVIRKIKGYFKTGINTWHRYKVVEPSVDVNLFPDIWQKCCDIIYLRVYQRNIGIDLSETSMICWGPKIDEKTLGGK